MGILPEKLYIFTNTLKTGGAEKQAILLFNGLVNKYDVSLIVYYGREKDTRMTRIVAFPDKVLYMEGGHLQKLWKLFHLFKENENVAVISFLATTNVINALIGTAAGVKYRLGGIRNSQLHWFKEFIQRHLHNKWLHYSVFNNQEGFEKFSERGFNKQKASVIPNAVEMPEPRSPHRNDKLQILSVGRFVIQKDYNTALDAINEAVYAGVALNYTIIGQGGLEEQLKTKVDELGLQDFVEIVINPDDVERYYRKADIVLSTSIFEGLSNSILEAMSFGIPVIATDVGDNHLLLQDNQSGFLVPVKRPDLITKKLVLLAEDPELRVKMGKQGRSFVSRKNTPELMTESYLSLIQNLSMQNA